MIRKKRKIKHRSRVVKKKYLPRGKDAKIDLSTILEGNSDEEIDSDDDTSSVEEEVVFEVDENNNDNDAGEEDDDDNNNDGDDDSSSSSSDSDDDDDDDDNDDPDYSGSSSEYSTDSDSSYYSTDSDASYEDSIIDLVVANLEEGRVIEGSTTIEVSMMNSFSSSSMMTETSSLAETIRSQISLTDDESSITSSQRRVKIDAPGEISATNTHVHKTKALSSDGSSSMADASSFDETNDNNGRRRWRGGACGRSMLRKPKSMLFLGCMIIAALGAGIGFAFLIFVKDDAISTEDASSSATQPSVTLAPSLSPSSRPSDDEKPSSAPTMSQHPTTTQSPTSNPTSDRYDHLLNLLFPVSPLIYQPGSVQEEALFWMVGDTYPWSKLFNDRQILERYILVLFHMATEGDLWTLQFDWLSSDLSICDWYGVTCSPKGYVSDLVLGKFGQFMSSLVFFRLEVLMCIL